MKGNIFDKRGIVPPSLDREQGREVFETLLSRPLPEGQPLRVERIMSFGQEHGMWYDQSWDEWVMVMRGEAALEWGDGAVTEMEAGDYLLIERHQRHRVLRASFDCVWLAVHLGGE
ncbi:MAG TPA: cupin domain-containing protein [Candidatus Rikenella faecigallinarum]|uniref:Cupin domain-containing protein n=1 Tax=Candidatus Rikenella faecigallinarum TaxID=2838745 RepID=A0A9D1TY03_9BACT|nr:cupin domain-containing protein [Candidatus Rikenella faecigallinarum]